MPARSLPSTLNDTPPDEGRSSSDVASISTEFADRSARLDAIGQGINAYRESTRRTTVRLDDFDDSGFDAALRLLSLGDGTCGDVFPAPAPSPGPPDHPDAA